MRIFRPDALQAPRNFQPIPKTSQQALWLEIGAGRGMHALNCAAQHPQKQLYAIERTAVKFHTFWQRFQANPLPNLHPIHADAIAWIVHALTATSLERVFILYPNPEPKNTAQRWLNMPFFAFLLSRLQTHGQIHLASNLPNYIHEAKQRAAHTWQLPYTERLIEGEGRTHFERKYLVRNEPCTELIFTKPRNYTTDFDRF